MLVDFQQAQADLTASPQLCIDARSRPELLQERYRLTDREWRRLVGIVNHPGMACNCMLYRANRLAPLVTHLPRLCKALGADLKTLALQYWSEIPETNVHAFVEAGRFAEFVSAKRDGGMTLAPDVAVALSEEGAILFAALRGSRTEADA